LIDCARVKGLSSMMALTRPESWAAAMVAAPPETE
jgi:hypothetical protein